jgi:hypothetical protein
MTMKQIIKGNYFSLCVVSLAASLLLCEVPKVLAMATGGQPLSSQEQAISPDFQNSTAWKLFLPLTLNKYKPNMLLLRCEQGLYRSQDGGNHWVNLSTTGGYTLSNDYGNPGQVLWARPDGLWRSQDQGEHWTMIGQFGAVPGVAVAQLTTTSGVPDALYVAFASPPGQSIWPLYSLDGGLSWQAVKSAPWVDPTPSEYYGQIVSVALAPKVGEVPIRLITTPSDIFNWYRIDVYRSGDYGASWAVFDFPNGLIGGLLLSTSPINPNRLSLLNRSLWGGGIRSVDHYHYRAFTSTDGGISYNELFIPTDEPGEVVNSPILSERLYVHSCISSWEPFLWGPWYQSEDGGLHWLIKNFPVNVLVPDSRDPLYLYGFSTTYDYSTPIKSEGMTSSDGGITWKTWPQQPCSIFQQLLSP